MTSPLPPSLFPHPTSCGIAVSTYMHLRIKFFCWGGGVRSPGDALVGEVVGAVGCVPRIVTAGPGQLLREGGNEVVQGPRHDGVVIRGNVESYNTDGKANSWKGGLKGRHD